jgi:hypothetical protein
MLKRSANLTSTALTQDFDMDCQSQVTQILTSEPVSEHVLTRAAISELYRFSGLSWKEIAGLFRVDPQTVHFWASGRPMNEHDEEHLQHLRTVILKIDCGFSEKNHTVLMTKKDEILPLDLLTNHEYERTIALLGPGKGRKVRPYSRVSSEIAKLRTPRSPAERINALHDSVTPTSGRLISAKSIKTIQKA